MTKQERDKYLTLDELKKLIEVIKNDRDLLIVILAGNLGLRIGEVVRLRVEDIDFKRNSINVPCLKRGKGRITRGELPEVYETLPLTKNMDIMLNDYIKKYGIKGFLFKGYDDNSHISERQVMKLFKGYIEKAGLCPKYTFHALRHFKGNMIYQKTKDLKAVQILLRHRNINSSAIYVSGNEIKKELQDKVGGVMP